MFPPDKLATLQPCTTMITGVEGNGFAPVGQFKCDIHMGPAFFKHIDVIVVDKKIPPLIGRTVLRHDTVTDCTLAGDSMTISRKFPKAGDVHTFSQVIPYTNGRPTFVQNNTNPLSSLSLSDKMKWLQTNKGCVLPTDHENQYELQKIVDLLIEYEEVLGGSEDNLGEFPETTRIPTTGEAKAIKQHPIAEAYRGKIDAEIDNMLRKGVIEFCHDPKGFNTPVFAVPKKNGSIRVVANFKRSLNTVLSSECDMAWQMPSLEDAINSIGGGNKYFSSIDLTSGYWHVLIHEDDRFKTSFQWGNRTYQYVRLPFGLKCAGQIFSRCLAKTLQPVQNKDNFVTYVDDVMTYGKTFTAYYETTKQVLHAAKQNGVRLNPSKCTFLQKRAKFLGRIITEHGFEADPENIEGVKQMQPPTTRAELLSTIGRMTWIRQFLDTRYKEKIRTQCFSQLINELHKLNRKKAEFEWTPEANAAFIKVKSRLMSSPVIQFANFDHPFILITDASEVAAGAVLMQEINGQKSIVAVASTLFNTTEQKWSTTEREAYAIVWAVGKFDYYVRGRKFLLLTDHRSLIYLDQTEFKNPKIARWQNILSEYSFVLQYIEGESNVIADMLSRPSGIKKVKTNGDPEPTGNFYDIGNSKLKVYVPGWCDEDVSSLKLMKPNDIRIAHCFTAECSIRKVQSDLLEMAEFQRADPYLAKIIQYLEYGSKKSISEFIDSTDHRGTIFKRNADRFEIDSFSKALIIRSDKGPQLVIPEKVRKYYLYQAHDNSGHMGRSRVTDFLRDYWWPGKQNDIIHYCDTCISCAQRKGSYSRNKPPMLHVQRGEKPFDVIYLDFVHMPISKCGKRYILTVLDSFSRNIWAIPCNRDRAIDACNGLLREVILRHGFLPKVISSDRGTHFTSALMAELCSSIGAKQQLHVSWRPQSSGNLERQHRTLKNSLYATMEEKRCSWVDALPYVVNAMNLSPNKSTGCSPYKVIYGIQPNFTLPEIPGKNMTSEDPLSYGMNLKVILDRIHSLVKLSSEAADLEMDKRHNAHIITQRIEIGDIILLHRQNSAQAKRTHLPWIGKFKVVKTNQNVVQIMDAKGKLDWVHRAHIRLIEERNPDLDINPSRNDLPPVAFDDPDFVPIRDDVNPPNVRSSGEHTVEMPSQVSRPKRLTKRVERLNIKTNRGQSYS